jgi:hypothetical protein
MMGFFSKLDQQIVDLLNDGHSAEDILATLHIEYNGLVSMSTIRETIEAYNFGDYDYSPWDNVG